MLTWSFKKKFVYTFAPLILSPSSVPDSAENIMVFIAAENSFFLFFFHDLNFIEGNS